MGPPALIPWDGPEVRIIEHQAQAPGHAALLIGDYLASLGLLEGVADDVDAVIPGHGSVGAADQVRARIAQDRTYVHGLREGRVPSDPRIGPSAKEGWEWVASVHEGQLQRLAQNQVLRGAPTGPILAVVDGRGPVSAWRSLRDAGYWSGVVAVHTAGTPPRDHGFPEIVAGTDRVDLGAALLTLHERFGARTVRVDSGGALNGALLSSGLVDEVSLLVHPALAAADVRHPWHGSGPLVGRTMTLVATRTLPNGLVWLRHRLATDAR